MQRSLSSFGRAVWVCSARRSARTTWGERSGAVEQRRGIFKGMEDLGNMGDVVKKMADLGRKLQSSEVVGEAGGGMVRVVIGGTGELKNIHIDSVLLKPKEKATVEDLVRQAHNIAHKKLIEDAAGSMTMEDLGRLVPK